MLPIVTPAEMRSIDAEALESVEELIERAAGRVARAARQMLGGVYGRRVSIIAGPGNNGADARVAGRMLEAQGVRVRVVDPGAPIPHAHLVIDGAFGTGMSRSYHPGEPPAGVPVLAVDIPSGVDGSTGEIHGSALAAQRTVTFAALKPGLLLGPGALLAGDIEVADIGLDVRRSRAWLFTEQDAVDTVPQRAPHAHKWKHAVAVVGGSAGMSGAPRLAAAAAMRAGAGYVRCSLPGGVAPADLDEVVYAALPASDWSGEVLASTGRERALVLGPGLHPDGARDVQEVISRAPADLPIVVDGTGLRLLGSQPQLREQVVLTPHDGEFESLTGHRPEVDRFAAVRRLSAATGATVLLKGPLTLIAAPDGRCMACAHGDERLATAGSGDVLSGVIAALLAHGLAPLSAATLGAWVHADAGRHGPTRGLVASDLLAGVARSLSALADARSKGSHATD